MNRFVVASFVALAAVACTVGTRPHQFLPALGPNGVTGSVTLRNAARVDIELLEVSDTTLTVMTAGGVAIVNYRDIRHLSLKQVGAVNGKPQALFREKARQLSRFPGGITPEIMAKLLASTNQTEPTVLTSGS